ncbi:hypothetical protein TNCV_1920481 [Trichonephila clavipes]|nr:hypothetical protein TNCV_1920481 [Trichonephila clavipes]
MTRDEACLTNESVASADVERRALRNKGGGIGKGVQLTIEKCAAIRFQTGRRKKGIKIGAEREERDLESRDQQSSDLESDGDFSDERRDHERRWCWRTGNNVLERWASALWAKD